MKYVQLLLALFLATSVAAIETYPMPEETRVTSIAADRAGNVWYADGSTKIVKRSPDGTFTTIIARCNTWAVAADTDSNLFATCSVFGSSLGVDLIRPDGTMSNVVNFSLGTMATSLDGSVLIGRNVESGTEVFRARGESLTSAGIVNVGDFYNLRGDEAGGIWVAGSEAIARIRDNEITLFPPAGFWIAFAGGQPWTASGALFGQRRAELLTGQWPESDYKSGTFWLTTNFNAVLQVHADGHVDQIQLPGRIEESTNPVAIGSDAVWTAKRGLLIAISRDEQPAPLHWNRGEIVSQDVIGNCCIEGTHEAYRVYSLPEGNIVRVLDYSFPPIGIGRDREWYAATEGNAALRKDADGRTLARYDTPDGAWLALPRHDGNVFIMGSRLDVITFSEFTEDGTLIAKTSAPRSDFYYLSADLSGDQCTIFYTDTHTSISRKNACEDTMPRLVLATSERITDLRVLANDELLVATPSSVVRYTSNGDALKQYAVDHDEWSSGRNLLLDVDGMSFWTAASTFEKVDIASGEIVERTEFESIGERTFMIGEPRPALFPNGVRRRGVRH